MKKNLGISLLLLGVVLFTAIQEPAFLKGRNLENILRWTAMFSLIGIGVSFVIITGGIDLSIGSLMALCACMSAKLMVESQVPPFLVMGIILCFSVLIGLIHGLLITKLKLQPFVVTLCGMMLYRGISRVITKDEQLDFGNEETFASLKYLATGKIPLTETFSLPIPLIFMVIFGGAAFIFLNKTKYGRYLLALGNNEHAARYSGIDTDKMKILAYLICSFMAGFAGILFALDINSVAPNTFGTWYELYAIAAAVLGGCSLRGGEGSIIGVLLGTAIMRVLNNSINILEIPTRYVDIMIGGVILFGAMADEIAKAIKARDKSKKSHSS